MNRSGLILQAFELQQQISQLMTGYQVENWLAIDLTATQLKSMVYIHSTKGRVNFRRLARALGVTPSAATVIVDRLVLQGLVRRIGNTDDRRTRWVIVSAKGKALLDGIRQGVTKETYRILQSLSEKELSMLIRAFSTVVKAAEVYLKSQNSD